MGLKETIANAVSAGFKAAGNVKTTVTVRTVTKTYDVDTGLTAEGTPIDEAVSGILTDYSKYEVKNSGGGVLIKDRKLIAQQADITSAPDPDSTRIVIAGSAYRIVSKSAGGLGITEDPAGATYRFHLRAA